MNIVNEDYTTDTITYVLHSMKAVSGTSENCYFNMGHYLRREYDFYVLQTITFVSAISRTAMFFLEIPDKSTISLYLGYVLVIFVTKSVSPIFLY